MKAATARRSVGIEVEGHPLAARDSIEARTFTRDLLLANLFGFTGEGASLWLSARARARRDLLWFSRNIMAQDRLSEEIHRSASDKLMSWMTRPHGFASYRDIRGNGKTTLATRCGSIWCTIQDPIECSERGWPIRGRESRLGITTLRTEFTNEILGVLIQDLESEGLRWAFPEMFPETPTRWGLKGITLNRGLGGALEPLRAHPLFATYPAMTRYIDPTFANGSLEKGRAGAHTHGEFIDDPVNEATWRSPVCVDTAVRQIRLTYNVTRPEQGFRIVIGNHWSPQDVVDRIDTEWGDWEVFLRDSLACDECKDGFPTDTNGLVPRKPNGDWQHDHVEPTFTWMMRESDGSLPDLARVRKSCHDYHDFAAQYRNRPMEGEATLWSASSLGSFEIRDPRFVAGKSVLSADSLIAYTVSEDKVEVMRVYDGEITITYDPAHGSIDPRSSRHAITVLCRTPADTFAIIDAWDAHISDPLEGQEAAIRELVSMIHRLKAPRVRIGIESVGLQRVIAGHLKRALRQPWLDGHPDPEGRAATWINFDHHIIPIIRSKAEGDKESWNRDSLSPLITTGALLVNPAIRNTDAILLAIEGFPVSRIGRDWLDSLSMHPSIIQNVPLSAERRRRMTRGERMRQRNRMRGAGAGSAYGWRFEA